MTSPSAVARLATDALDATVLREARCSMEGDTWQNREWSGEGAVKEGLGKGVGKEGGGTGVGEEGGGEEKGNDALGAPCGRLQGRTTLQRLPKTRV